MDAAVTSLTTGDAEREPSALARLEAGRSQAAGVGGHLHRTLAQAHPMRSKKRSRSKFPANDDAAYYGKQ